MCCELQNNYWQYFQGIFLRIDNTIVIKKATYGCLGGGIVVNVDLLDHLINFLVSNTRGVLRREVELRTNMATDFDAIYEEEDEEERYYEESMVVNVPDPVVIRGAGNITVLVTTSNT